MPKQERENVVGSALRKPLFQGQPVNFKHDVPTNIDIANIARGTIHLNPEGVEFSLPLDPHRYNTGDIKAMRPMVKNEDVAKWIKFVKDCVGADERTLTLKDKGGDVSPDFEKIEERRDCFDMFESLK